MHGNRSIVETDSCGETRPRPELTALSISRERILVHVWDVQVLAWPWAALLRDSLSVLFPQLFCIVLMHFYLILADLNRDLLSQFLLLFSKQSFHFVSFLSFSTNIFDEFESIRDAHLLEWSVLYFWSEHFLDSASEQLGLTR